jgi:hypothetical protein
MLDCLRRVPVAVLVLALAAPALTRPARGAPEEGPPKLPSPKARALPGGIALEADRVVEDRDHNRYVLEGAVTVSWNQARIQADRVVVRDQRYVEADGHVLLLWSGNRVAGTRLMYDLETERGVVEDAIGQIEGEYYFWARTAEKIGEDKIHLESATVTTCTQPIAYWSLLVTSANIRVERYARMWNVRLNAGKLPLFYLPYLIWPVKEDRAAGLLLPDIRTTHRRGRVINQELFLPIGRSADLTLLGRYYTEAGFGGGGTLRVIPNRSGRAELSGFYIQDQILAGEGRYRATYRQTQSFRNGFRMVGDINLVSDFNYYNDFETELNLVSSPTTLARLEFSRNGRWTSLNVRDLRREQLFSGGDELVQQTLPEIEWRGRSRQLGRTPLYLGFESSLASIQQRGLQQSFPIDTDYLRGDLSPELSVPISPVPWLDINPRVSYRLTYYTQRQVLDPTGGRQVVDEPLTRTLVGAGLELVGPKSFRVYDTPNSRFSKRYKHTIEPHLTYGYLEEFEELADVLVFDEVDRVSGAGAQIAYGVRSRLFAKRPRAAAGPPEGMGESILFPGGAREVVPETSYEAAEPAGAPAPAEGEPVEIATIEVRQSRSFERDLSTADLDGDGVREEHSPYSSVQLSGRFSPSPAWSLDLRSGYDILFRRVQDLALSGTVAQPWARLRYSFVHREGLGVGLPDDTQVRLGGGLSVFRHKLRIDFDGSIDANPQAGQARVPEKRWGLTYATQCCTFRVEKLDRSFSSLEPRRDLHFRVDLRGLGKLLETTF